MSFSSSTALRALCALVLAACAAEAGDDSTGTDGEEIKAKTTIQMNDVSVLYPLAKTEAELASGYLTPASVGAAGPLLPEPVFDVIAQAVQGIKGPPSFADLHAVAFRLDPCFAQIGPVTSKTKCDHQLRIVFQGLNAGTTGSSKKAVATDNGFHAFYTLTQEELDEALKEIVALRLANSTGNDLGALQVHPVMARQGLDGPMAKGLNAIVLKFAGAAKLTKLTGFVGVFAQHTSWNFAGADVVQGKAKLQVIPGLEGKPTQESLGLGTAPEKLISLTFMSTTTKDDVQPLLKATSQEDTAAARQKAFDSALRIENPDLHSPNTVDCVSCHTAEIARQLVGQDFFHLDAAGNANGFVPDPNVVTTRDVKPAYLAKQPHGLAVNVHAFSYDGQEPMVIQRVINETAAIVAAVNATKPKP